MKKNKWVEAFNKNGFSLIEALTVLVIIAILASVGIPTFSKILPDMRLRSAAQDLYGRLQEAKIDAVKKNATSNVTFNQANGTYITATGTTINLDEEYEHSVEYGRMGGSPAIDLTDNKVEFNARGMVPTYSGAIYLKNKKNNSYEIKVLTSGVMTLKKWNGSTYE